MKKLETLAFDQMLLTIIRGLYDYEPLAFGYGQFQKELEAKGVECDRHQVRRSLERLSLDKKIAHKWNGKNFLTRPLEQIVVEEETHTAFINEKPKAVTPEVWGIYKHLKDTAVGVDNAVSMQSLAKQFNISERKVRKIIEGINFNGYILDKKFNDNIWIKDGTFMRLIMGDNNGYYLVSNKDEIKTIQKRYNMDLYVASIKRKIIRQKLGLDNQSKLTIGEFERDYEKTVSDDLVKV